MALRRRLRKGHGDSKSTVTMLSHAAVTLLVANNQSFRCVCVTDDSKFSLFNFLVAWQDRCLIVIMLDDVD